MFLNMYIFMHFLEQCQKAYFILWTLVVVVHFCSQDDKHISVWLCTP